MTEGERTVSGPLAQLPNALTVARLIVIPVYVVLILASTRGHSWAAAILFPPLMPIAQLPLSPPKLDTWHFPTSPATKPSSAQR